MAKSSIAKHNYGGITTCSLKLCKSWLPIKNERYLTTSLGFVLWGRPHSEGGGEDLIRRAALAHQFLEKERSWGLPRGHYGGVRRDSPQREAGDEVAGVIVVVTAPGEGPAPLCNPTFPRGNPRPLLRFIAPYTSISLTPRS